MLRRIMVQQQKREDILGCYLYTRHFSIRLREKEKFFPFCFCCMLKGNSVLVRREERRRKKFESIFLITLFVSFLSSFMFEHVKTERVREKQATAHDLMCFPLNNITAQHSATPKFNIISKPPTQQLSVFRLGVSVLCVIWFCYQMEENI